MFDLTQLLLEDFEQDMRKALTEGPQSRVQPSLIGSSTTETLGASFRYSRATSADCRNQK